jgi:hypothetical protein
MLKVFLLATLCGEILKITLFIGVKTKMKSTFVLRTETDCQFFEFLFTLELEFKFSD